MTNKKTPKIKRTFQVLLCCALLFSCKYSETPQPSATEITTDDSTTFPVIRITDGDTFDLLKDGAPMRIRIFAIDAPERGMPFYKVSKKYLAQLIGNKQVSVKFKSSDGYGRWVCQVSIGSEDVAQEMVRAGMAWHFKRYSGDKVLNALETEARNARLGLWRDDHPVAPWEARKIQRNKSKGILKK